MCGSLTLTADASGGSNASASTGAAFPRPRALMVRHKSSNGTRLISQRWYLGRKRTRRKRRRRKRRRRRRGGGRREEDVQYEFEITLRMQHTNTHEHGGLD